MNNFNFFLTASMFYMTTLIEKEDIKQLCKILIKNAQALKENLLIKFGIISKGIFETLKYAKTGIKD